MARMTTALARLLVADRQDRPEQQGRRTTKPSEPAATVRIPRQRRGSARHVQTGVRSPRS